jgi:hypothetical protein
MGTEGTMTDGLARELCGTDLFTPKNLRCLPREIENMFPRFPLSSKVISITGRRLQILL